MKEKGRKHSPSSKAKVYLESLECEETAAQISARYEIQRNLVTKWKKDVQDVVSLIFSKEYHNWNEEDENLH